MKIAFRGAAGMVTGSCYEVTTPDLHFLVDCGMFQGEPEELNRHPFAFKPSELDHVILTHAHIDHSGLIPRLVKEGFRGTVLCTSATLDLARIMLPDSGHIQESEAVWRQKKGPRQGLGDYEPLYTEADAREALKHFSPIDYDTDTALSDSTSVRFRDAGHILGSAFLELRVAEDGETTVYTFSGDVGNVGQPLIRDPEKPGETQVVLMESTYGDRLHDEIGMRADQLARVIRETVARGGNVVIPSFAVGRTQDVLFELLELLRKGTIPEVPIYVDSPLATSATEIYQTHTECFDAETVEFLKDRPRLFHGPEVHFVRDAEESKSLNGVRGAVIISASGMCEVGRIVHHLKHNLWRPECCVLFVGFQAQGTLGRRIMEGAKEVKLFGEPVLVRARIESIGSFSAHADQKGLMDWISAAQGVKTVFLVHGEPKAQEVLRELVHAKLGCDVLVPNLGAVAHSTDSTFAMSMGKTAAPESAERTEASRGDHRGVVARQPAAGAGAETHPIPADVAVALARRLAELSEQAALLSSRIRSGTASASEVARAKELAG